MYGHLPYASTPFGDAGNQPVTVTEPALPVNASRFTLMGLIRSNTPPTPTFYQEPFTGTNSTTPSGWTNRMSSVVIQGNEAAGGAAWSINVATYTGQTFSPNQYAKATVRTLDGRAFAVGVRCNGTSYEGYWAHWDGTNSVTIRRGLVTVLQTITSVTLTAGDVLEVRAIGGAISAWKNGTQIGTDATDGTYQTGHGGLYINHTTIRLDDFETGQLGAADTADLYFDFEAGTDGDVASAAIIASSVHPGPPWGSISTNPSPLVYTKIATAGERARLSTVTTGGTTYTDAGTRGLRIDHTDTSEYISYDPPTDLDKVSMGFWFNTGFPVTGFTPLTMSLFFCDGTEYAALSLAPNNLGYHPIGLETISGNTFGTGTQINTGTWYWITIQYDRLGGYARLAVYDTSGTQVGATIQAALKVSPPQVVSAFIGLHTSHGATASAYTYYDDVVINWTTGAFPLLP